VDDHALFRESLARLFASETDFKVIGTCGTTEEAAVLIKEQQVDLLMLDFDLGPSNCIGFVRSVKQQGFQGKILLVTAGVGNNHIAELVQLGVAGIFLKHDLPARLIEAIRDVLAGKVWLDQDMLKSTLVVGATSRTAASLTARERQVLSHIFAGLSNKEIAEKLTVSEGGVKATIQQLFSKTGVRTRSQLVRLALEKYKELL